MSALKISKKGKSSSRSQTGTESDSCSSQSQEKSKFNKHYLNDKERIKRTAKGGNKVTFLENNEANKELKIRKVRETCKPDTKILGSVAKTLRCSDKRSDKNVELKPSVIVKPKIESVKNFCNSKSEVTLKNVSPSDGTSKTCIKSIDSNSGPNPSNGKSGALKKMDSTSVKRDADVSKVCPVVAQQCNKKLSEASKLRTIRRKSGLIQGQAQALNKTVSFKSSTLFGF